MTTPQRTGKKHCRRGKGSLARRHEKTRKYFNDITTSNLQKCLTELYETADFHSFSAKVKDIMGTGDLSVLPEAVEYNPVRVIQISKYRVRNALAMPTMSDEDLDIATEHLVGCTIDVEAFEETNDLERSMIGALAYDYIEPEDEDYQLGRDLVDENVLKSSNEETNSDPPVAVSQIPESERANPVLTLHPARNSIVILRGGDDVVSGCCDLDAMCAKVTGSSIDTVCADTPVLQWLNDLPLVGLVVITRSVDAFLALRLRGYTGVGLFKSPHNSSSDYSAYTQWLQSAEPAVPWAYRYNTGRRVESYCYICMDRKCRRFLCKKPP